MSPRGGCSCNPKISASPPPKNAPPKNTPPPIPNNPPLRHLSPSTLPPPTMGRNNRLLLLLLLLLTTASATGESPDDKAIADLIASLSNLPSSWRRGADPCTGALGEPFDGLSCDGRSGRVTAVDLPRRSLSGSLPDSIVSLSSLRSLQLQGNALSGPLPSLSGLASLTRLVLNGNAFNSVPADFLRGLASLKYLSIDNIPFAPWAVPDAVTGCASLETFSASNASVTGAFPDVLANLSSLRALILSYNNLTGGLPPGLAGLTSLESLQLNNQKSDDKLSGAIDVVASMKSLKLVWLQSNAFVGSIPDLSGLQLESFDVRDNQLTGVVPASLTEMPSLRNVTLSNNYLQGPRVEFGNGVSVDAGEGNGFCTVKPGPCNERVTTLLAVAGGLGYPLELAETWTGNDPCDGWIGVSCVGAREAVVVVNLANKNFSGTISPAIGNLTGLVKLILSNNHLTGTIPDSLTTLPQLSFLDVTNNSLTGELPKFKPSVEVLADGNRFGESGNVGGRGASSGGGSSSLQSGGSSGLKSGVGMIAGVLIAVVIIACIGLFLLHRRRKKIDKFRTVSTKSPPGEPEMTKIEVIQTNGYSNASGAGPSEHYSYASSGSTILTDVFESLGMHLSVEMLQKATDNFSEDSIIGKGGFGVVYKGKLNGKLVAVKRTDSGSMGSKGQEEFMAEIDVLRKVRHRHLVALLWYCNDGNERLLVYEYMSGGTLRQHLCDLQLSGYPPLVWKQRMTIALDVARGIEYLHSLAQESFIHRDLKPSNILLDKDLRAKVSDFGLVKLAKDTDKSMMTRVAGTFGYLAPEYATTGKVSTKIDVYAYGVILMEMIAGRKVLDDTVPEDETHLVTIFRRNLLDKEKFMKFVDPTLELSGEAWNSLMEVADLAWHCTAREPHQRPEMCHCVNRLSSLLNQWKPTNVEDDEYETSCTDLNEQLAKWRSEEFTIMDSFSTYTVTRQYDRQFLSYPVMSSINEERSIAASRYCCQRF